MRAIEHGVGHAGERHELGVAAHDRPAVMIVSDPRGEADAALRHPLDLEQLQELLEREPGALK